MRSVVILGRPNVGKSTLFNRLTKTRNALVADTPGVTRDRQYGLVNSDDEPFYLIDTGGLEPAAHDTIAHQVRDQALLGLADADLVLFVVDARAGITPDDSDIAELLRDNAYRVLLVANKCENTQQELMAQDFYQFGLGAPATVSAAHGDNCQALVHAMRAHWQDDALITPPSASNVKKIAIVGRPNAGKSTLINTLIGEQRVITNALMGTTRDAIHVPFTWRNEAFELIDTAGIRKRAKTSNVIEKFSVIKTLHAIRTCDVAILLLDGTVGCSELDLGVVRLIEDAGRALVVAVNKSDLMDRVEAQRQFTDIRQKLKHIDYAHFHSISAKHNVRLGRLYSSVKTAIHAAEIDIATPDLTRLVQDAVAKQPPHRSGGKHRPKLRYAHQGGMRPPLIVIHGNAVGHIAKPYVRYLESCLRKRFKLDGTPLRIKFVGGNNPFVKT